MNNITDTEALRAAWTVKRYCKGRRSCEGCVFTTNNVWEECECVLGTETLDMMVFPALPTTKNNQTAKSDAGKAQLSLVPTQIIYDIARIREYGTAKYKDPENWKTVEPQRYIDAAYRHFLEFVKDKDSVDKESGMPHLWHCACNLAFLAEMEDMARRMEV